MALTISLYNHTARLLANGLVQEANLRVRLYTSATFDATDATLGDVAGTEVAVANGYEAGGLSLTGVAYSTFGTNDARLNASDAVWIANGGPITAGYAIIFGTNGVVPLAFIDFGGTQTAADGNEFRIEWNSGGIFTFTVA